MLKAKNFKGLVLLLLLVGFGMYISLWVLHPTAQEHDGSPTTSLSFDVLTASVDNLQSALKDVEKSLHHHESSINLKALNTKVLNGASNMPAETHTNSNTEQNNIHKQDEPRRIVGLRIPNEAADRSFEPEIHNHQAGNLHATPVVRDTRSLQRKTLQLLSLNKPTEASVRGNLGPVSVIVNENVQDWLKDRWQCKVSLHM
jgi:hypothetical protein